MEKKRVRLIDAQRFPGEFVRAALEQDFELTSEPAPLQVEIVSDSEIRLSNGVTLRLAPVVGTGMGGRLRRMANQIYRATYIKVRDNQARLSTIHALDVARAVAVAASGAVPPGEYALSALPVEVNRLVDALAKRITDKRVAELTAKNARWWALGLDIITLGGAHAREALREDSVDAIFGHPQECREVFGFLPRDPADYLASHTYGPDDI